MLVGVADRSRAGGGDIVIDVASPVVDQVQRACGRVELMGAQKG